MLVLSFFYFAISSLDHRAGILAYQIHLFLGDKPNINAIGIKPFLNELLV